MSRAHEKVESVQLLRAVAAGVVAIAHGAFAFADGVGSGLGIPNIGAYPAQIGVAMFFVVSGYVMVVSSRNLFARAGAARTFWTRRAVRILPPYWLATFVLLGVFLAFDQPFDLSQLPGSLALLPLDQAGFQGRPLFLLWPGWTLFYEMVFYLLFGIGLAKGRAGSVGFAALALCGLVAAGILVPVESAALTSLTRPVLLLFLVGMALAWMREARHSLPAAARYLSLALALLCAMVLPAPAQADALDFTYLAWAGIPASLLALAVLGGPLRVPAFGLVDRLGDASYALYLLHVPLAHAWIRLFPFSLGAWTFVISLMLATYAASLLAYRFVERPMTLQLNALLGAGSRDDGLLQRSGV